MLKSLRGGDKGPEDGPIRGAGDGDRFDDFKFVSFDSLKESCASDKLFYRVASPFDL